MARENGRDSPWITLFLIVVAVVAAAASVCQWAEEVRAQNEQPCYDQYQQPCTATPQPPPPPQATRRPTRTPTPSATIPPNPTPLPTDTPTRVPTLTPSPTATPVSPPPPGGPIRKFTVSLIDTVIGWIKSRPTACRLISHIRPAPYAAPDPQPGGHRHRDHASHSMHGSAGLRAGPVPL